ncbi:MAG: Gfo/Idh/MocA family oxidoreductase [Candidatus Marinimicrobia bacterium]|nr:Gfo/Idh/MocA family oxidoreductase [Candidatus Neomarinimicrobiota bacterium]MCF7828750.1 Gfo/Idh/MocA family oxidoreductase [Candidatus Neomarinimicrobiota bacterium]MCF7880667.1 Gfo/Idh/MocA family oxidoreductase [Candidatus Neomarinimicrobiota bacterium]
MDKHKYIAIIGAGQLGSRHLQGLTKSKKSMKIFVIDPDKHALESAKTRYQESINPQTTSTVYYHKHIKLLPKNLDLAIMATTANVRKNVTDLLLKHADIKNLILEKVVFQDSRDFSIMNKRFDETNTKTWVNCSRRAYPFFKEIKGILHKSKTVFIKVKGENWGLASNSIHFIDLLSYLTDAKNFNVDISGLQPQLVPSKREGFIEIKGSLKIITERGDSLEAVDQVYAADNSLSISIKTENEKFLINENEGTLWHESKTKTRKSNTKEIRVPFQSEMTGKIIDQIIDTGQCDLTPYNECQIYHIPMLEAFNSHLSKITGEEFQACPIT